MSKRENALNALLAVITAALPDVVVERNELGLDRIDRGGRIIIEDGTPGKPQVFLSPVSYYWSHEADVVFEVQGKTAAARDALIDTLVVGVTSAIEVDPTLGGVVENARALPLDFENVPIAGGQDVKAVQMPVLLQYETASPTG